MMKKTMMFATMAALFCFCFTASAQETSSEAYEPEAIAVDYDEAIEYGKLLDTSVDENGVTWETYYDEAQNVMWSQTAGATKEQVLGFLESDVESTEAESVGSAALDTICAFQWLVPEYMRLYDDSLHDIEMYADESDVDYDGSCGPACRQWTFVRGDCDSPFGISNAGGYIQSILTGSFNYCSNYNAEYWDLDNATPDWNNSNDFQNCWYEDGSYHYGMKEDGDVDGESEWDYGADYDPTNVGAHMFHACGADHWVVTRYVVTLC